MPRDNLPEQVPPVKKPSFLDRMFDGKSDGRFVKRLLIVMLLVATTVQPFSLIYTAYAGHGEFDLSRWWEYTPGLAVLLFVALDWTIMPLAYFFATTNKPGLKIMLGLMLLVVTAGALDGYFVATERFIAMRLEEITRHALKVEAAKANVVTVKEAQAETLAQQTRDRELLDKKRGDLTGQLKAIDDQIKQIMADKAADNQLHKENIDAIAKAGKLVNYPYIGPKTDEENKRHNAAQAEFDAQIKDRQANKVELQVKLNDMPDRSEAKVDSSNADVKAAEEAKKAVQQDFDVAVLNNQVYRWAGVLHFKSARNVTADEANRILMIFAGMVATGYVVAQVMLSIAYYGKDRKGVVESAKINWSLAVRGARAYFARKRRGVYREKKVVEYVPTSERTRVVYVPVNPGGPVPPAEEFVSKPSVKVANDSR